MYLVIPTMRNNLQFEPRESCKLFLIVGIKWLEKLESNVATFEAIGGLLWLV